MYKHETISTQPEFAQAAATVAQTPLQAANENIYQENFCRIPIQHKLAIGAVDDPLEYEADSVADTVMRMPGNNFIQRQCAHCAKEEEIQRKPLASFIQRKESATTVNAPAAVSNQINSSRGNGSNMDGNTQSFMQSRFGADFSNVKIHTGSDAIQMNRELNAKAFTVGSDIYFNEGQYNPGSGEGKNLLAHELTHTVQQRGSASASIQRVPKGCEGGNFTPLKPAQSADAGASWKKLVGRQKHTSADKDKQQHANDSVTLFLSTASGKWMITELDSIFSGKGCKNVKVNLKFVDRTSDGTTAWGYTSNDVDTSRLFPCEQVNSYTVEIVYRLPEANVIGEYSTIEAEMAETLQHEFGHVWFVNTLGQSQPGGGYTTGHGDLNANPNNIDPRFCAVILSVSKELYVMADEAKKQAEQIKQADKQLPQSDFDSLREPGAPAHQAPSSPSLIGVQGVVRGGKSAGGPLLGTLGVDLVLGRASAFHAGPRLIFMKPDTLLAGGTIGGRFINNESPIFVDIEAGIVAQIPTSSVPGIIQGVGALGSLSLGHEFGRDGVRPFIEINGFVIVNDVTNPRGGGIEAGATLGLGVRL